METFFETINDEPAWIPYEEASHIIVGWNERGGGILNTARGELEAHRRKKFYVQAGYKDVQVKLNVEEEYKKVSENIFKVLDF